LEKHNLLIFQLYLYSDSFSREAAEKKQALPPAFTGICSVSAGEQKESNSGLPGEGAANAGTL
jgi:hypothetical protein